MEGAVNSGMTSITTLLTSFWSGMTDVVGTMMAEGNEIMLIPIGFMVAGGIIGLASRILGR